MIGRALRTGAATLLVAAAWVALPAPAAQAAACSTSSGVTVIADFNDLGKGVPAVCLADGGGKHASDLFAEAGLPLTYAQRQPGFVCRVSGVPTSDPCVNTSPASAYWGLWWSNGNAGSGWTYSSLGVGSLTIPAGGLVAFSWDDVSGDDKPSAPSQRPQPSVPAPAPAPSHSPTHAPSAPGPGPGTHPSPAPSTSGTPDPTPGAGTPPAAPGAPGAPGAPAAPGAPGQPGASPSGRPTLGPRASTTAGPRRHGQVVPPVASPGATPLGDVSDDPVPAVAPPADDGGLPGWVAPGVVVVLFGAAVATLWWRRRAGS